MSEIVNLSKGILHNPRILSNPKKIYQRHLSRIIHSDCQIKKDDFIISSYPKSGRTWVRFFTVFGPWGRPDMAYYKFANKIMRNEPIDVYNYGKMKRDFTYIDDIVDGIVSAINKKFNFEIFNLGNNKPVNLLEFIEILEKKIGKKAKKNMRPLQTGDMIETFADISKSQKLLGYNPKIDIEKGISKFIDWYKKYNYFY